MIIAARSFPDTPRTLDEADMFTLLLERQHDLIPRVSSAAANQRGAWRKGGWGGGGRERWGEKKEKETAALGVERSQIRRVPQSQ